MAGVSQIEIRESCKTLKALMGEQVTIQGRERIHSLYLLKSQEARNVGHAAHIRSPKTYSDRLPLAKPETFLLD